MCARKKFDKSKWVSLFVVVLYTVMQYYHEAKTFCKMYRSVYRLLRLTRDTIHFYTPDKRVPDD